jgi:ATP-dependent DNA helicase DinG
MQMSTSHTKVERLLAEVVTVKTKGAATAARPGQLQLACDIMDRLDAARNGAPAAETQLAGEAPTGVGKSFALLAAAFVDADNHGRRTVISTQQKVLQNQIVAIDAPDMQKAAANLGMKAISVEVLKGWQSYLCLQRAHKSADTLTQGEPWQGYLERASDGLPAEVTIEGVTYDRGSAQHALQWALSGDHDEDSRDYGEIASYRPPASDPKPGTRPPVDPLQLITIAKEDCPDSGCPFWDDGCAPQKSRQRASQADVIVTNHALLGIQAALGARTVFGNKLLGDFDNLMVDEAHDLSDEVRTRGTQAFSGPSLARAAHRIIAFIAEAQDINRIHAATDLSGQQAADDTIQELEGIAGYLLEHETEMTAALDDFLRVGAGDDQHALLKVRSYDRDETLHDLVTDVLAKLQWAETALKRTSDTGDAVVQRSMQSESPRWTAISSCTSLAGVLERFSARGPRIDAAWVQAKNTAAGAHGEGSAAPLDVASRIMARLWHNGEDPRASIAVSATMPENFVRACGMEAEVECVEYNSPYAAAYANTAVFIPKLTATEIEELTLAPADENGRAVFNHVEHPLWAAAYIGGLVRANRGAALVLAATADAGKHYARHLRRLFPGLQILDQWSMNKEDAIQAWKDDESAVLVGTKSLMTGVDAHGATNSLVILDKISRSPEDPLLKSLVDYLTPTLGWEAAVREVYVVPGANLLKQSGGRLIRRETDRGMFAVLEPRLHKANSDLPGHFSQEVKKVHKRAVRAFGQRIFDYNEALDFLENQSEGRPGLSSFRPPKAA